MALTSNNYLHITAAGTYVLSPNFTGLETIRVNTLAAGSITVSEGNQAKVIAVIDTSNSTKHDFDLANLNGCVLVVTGTADITAIWQ